MDYNTRSTQKCPVRQQNAWFHTKTQFDTGMAGSTQKKPSQHASVDIAIIKCTPTILIEIIV